MILQSKAKMYLGSERGFAESHAFRSRYCFNFNQYHHQHKVPFGSLCAFNEDVLSPLQSLSFTTGENIKLVLIPLFGEVTFAKADGDVCKIKPGCVPSFFMRKNERFTLSNTQSDEPINYLQLWILEDEGNHPNDLNFAEVHPDENLNAVKEVSAGVHHSVSIGKFGGREEGRYKRKRENSGVFVFVIDGDMEVQHRLVGAGDGLALWETEEIEWEALSSSAILVLAEVSLQAFAFGKAK